MNVTHTPGPWKVGEEIEHDDFGDLARIWGGDELIATVNCDDYANCAMDQANARLIAEAPAILEALKAVTDYYTMTDAQYREHYGCLLDGDAAEQHEQHVASARAIIERIERS